ncbi:MAG: response regulator transcription factor [Bacillota bacterium]
MQKRILILESIEKKAEKISAYLENYSFKVYIKTQNRNILKTIIKKNVGLIILSENFNNYKSKEICKKLRKNFKLPIIFISHQKDIELLVKFFEIGIDDYVLKPICLRELVARIKAKFNQEKRILEEISNSEFNQNDLKINKLSKTVFINEKVINFSEKEYEIFVYLVKNKNQTISRKNIFKYVWRDFPIGNMSHITVHINNIRKKINSVDQRFITIETIWGVGYKLKIKSNIIDNKKVL